MLLRRGCWVNHKRVERIWRQEGLKAPCRQLKRTTAPSSSSARTNNNGVPLDDFAFNPVTPLVDANDTATWGSLKALYQ